MTAKSKLGCYNTNMADMEFESAINLIELSHYDIGLLVRGEDFEIVGESELNERKQVLNEFLNSLSREQLEFFVLKQTLDVPLWRRHLAENLLLDENSPARKIY